MRLLLAQLFTAAMVIAGLLMGVHYDWPDYVHTDYGFPLTWATHIESTILGPVNSWLVNPINLAADIAVWTLLSLVVVAVVSVLQKSRRDLP